MPTDMTSIDHLIILTMENRSFDHYLGSLALEGRADIDGLADPARTNLDKQGNGIPNWNMGHLYNGYGDAPHGRKAQVASYNKGANDGFVKEYQKAFPTRQNGAAHPNIPMGYYTRETLPILYTLADRFTVCDHWFCSTLSSTWPNRKYLLSGRRDEDDDTQTIPSFPGFKTTPFFDFLEDQIDPKTGNKFTWKSYFSDLPFLGFWYQFAIFHAFKNFSTIVDFTNDCREDRLPTVSVIDPPFSIADDHPAHDVRIGQKFIGLVVDALTHSEAWHKSALVILYDENGGFYDHCPPPQSFEIVAGQRPLDNPLGFRVPAIVISPYSLCSAPATSIETVQGRACNTTFDHTSIMKSISVRWNIVFPEDTFGTRWRRAPDIWTNCFDFTQNPLDLGTYTMPKDSEAVPFQNALAIHNLDWATGVEEIISSDVGGIEAFLERIFHLPGLKSLDKRAEVHNHLLALERNVNTLKNTLRHTGNVR